MEVVLRHRLTDHGDTQVRERMDVSRDAYRIPVHDLAGNIFPLPDLYDAAGVEARVQDRKDEAATCLQEFRQRREQRLDDSHIHEGHRTDGCIELLLAQTHQSLCPRTVHNPKLNTVALCGRTCPGSLNHALGDIHAENASA